MLARHADATGSFPVQPPLLPCERPSSHARVCAGIFKLAYLPAAVRQGRAAGWLRYRHGAGAGRHAQGDDRRDVGVTGAHRRSRHHQGFPLFSCMTGWHARASSAGRPTPVAAVIAMHIFLSSLFSLLHCFAARAAFSSNFWSVAVFPRHIQKPDRGSSADDLNNTLGVNVVCHGVLCELVVVLVGWWFCCGGLEGGERLHHQGGSGWPRRCV